MISKVTDVGDRSDAWLHPLITLCEGKGGRPAPKFQFKCSVSNYPVTNCKPVHIFLEIAIEMKHYRIFNMRYMLLLLILEGSFLGSHRALGQWYHELTISGDPASPGNPDPPKPIWAIFITEEVGLHARFKMISPSIGSAASLHYTNDGGASWVSAGNVYGTGALIGLLDIHHPTGTIYLKFQQGGSGWLRKFVDGESNDVLWQAPGYTSISVVDTSSIFMLRSTFQSDHLHHYANGINNEIDTLPLKTWMIHFPSDSLGYIAARSVSPGPVNAILRTMNGGLDWEELLVDPEINIKKFRIPSYEYGYALCEDGKIARTHDAGLTWSIEQISEHELNDIYFLNDTLGYVAGDNGVIMRTNDGGITWTLEEIDSSASISRIYFIGNLGFVHIKAYSTIQVFKRELLLDVNSTVEAMSSDILIWPNPSKENVNVAAPWKVERYELISLLGEVVEKGSPNVSTFTLDLSHYSANFFHLRIWSVQDEVITKRLSLIK